jgi:hypothetical protein
MSCNLKLGQLPAHASARTNQAATASNNYQYPMIEGYTPPKGSGSAHGSGSAPQGTQVGMAGGYSSSGSQCQFPAPPPKRCYCSPAAYSSLDGRDYQRLLDAYGQSRPCPSYY